MSPYANTTMSLRLGGNILLSLLVVVRVLRAGAP